MGTPNQLLVGITDCLKPYLEYLTFQSFEQIIGNASFNEVVQGYMFKFTIWMGFAHGPYSLDSNDRVHKVPVSRVMKANPDGSDSIHEIVHTDLVLKLIKGGGTDLHFYIMHSVFVPTPGFLSAKKQNGMEMWSKDTAITSAWDNEHFEHLIPKTFLEDGFWKDVEAWIKKSREPRRLSLKMLRDLEAKIQLDRERG